MGTAQLLGRLRRARAAREAPDDEITAELTENFWRAYDARMASVGFRDVARRFPGLVGQAVRLGWSASRVDTAATIALNLASGVLAGYALFATTGVLQALFAGGPTPQRVRAALPSLLLVAVATAARSGISAAAGWAQSRLEPQVDQAVEVRLFDLTSQVELAAFDDSDFHDRMQRARDRGVYSASHLRAGARASHRSRDARRAHGAGRAVRRAVHAPGLAVRHVSQRLSAVKSAQMYALPIKY
jgi:ATP-binding cassette subfamily B protein/ATP-binding cassette subfamily C protein